MIFPRKNGHLFYAAFSNATSIFIDTTKQSAEPAMDVYSLTNRSSICLTM